MSAGFVTDIVTTMGPPPPRAVKRSALPLKDKVDLIKTFEKNGSKTSVRQLPTQFNCGKTQVAEILKRKAEIMTAFEKNCDSFFGTIHT